MAPGNPTGGSSDELSGNVTWDNEWGLVDPAYKAAQELIRLAAESGINLRVTEGYRSPERQNELYAQGRTAPGNRVTNARGGQSNHQKRTAFDVVVLNDKGQPDWESPHWDELGKFAEMLGLNWGGNFKSIKDRPHFEWIS